MKLYAALLFVLFTFSAFGQQTDVVDFEHITADISLNFKEETVTGNMIISFKAKKDIDSVYLDAKNITSFEAKIGQKKLKSTFDKSHLIFKKSFKTNETYDISLNYSAKPDRALYFVNNEGKPQMWTQGQGKYTSNWLPSIDDMNDKIEFDLNITAPKMLQVIANGKLTDISEKGESKTWNYDMQHPMASYLVAFAAGDYDKQELVSASGIPLELYYYPEDSLKVEPTYRYSKQIFDFLENEIGVPFPWQNYKEIPVKDFLYAGMENTTATIFSDTFMVDSIGFIDRNYVDVNAHELAHQWFGDLVTEKSGTHHWLQEGFATYYAFLAEKEIFGEDYFYWQLYQTAEQLKELSDQGKGEKLLNSGASSLTFYQKGAWALHILREEIGDEVFRTAVKNYLEAHKFSNVETSDFIAAAEEASGKDLTDFQKNWLNQSAFQAAEALESLKKSSFIKDYLLVNGLRKIPFDQKEELLTQALTLPNDYIGQEAIYQLASESLTETLPLYKTGFESNNLFVRQAIAVSLETVPQELKAEFESLLDDDSYVTKETALYKLWISFPENRSKYLKKLAGITGFSDRNIETLWLALSMATPEYDSQHRETRYTKLINYTDSRFPFEVREHAFQYLYQLQLYETQSLENLVSACVHYNWRFAQSSRSILDMLLKDLKWKTALNDLTGLPQKETDFLNKKLQQ
tara:strand:- start:130400 stop:132472 length:2073 start_codon:yes stop_codon:yes gene_type:complete